MSHTPQPQRPSPDTPHRAPVAATALAAASLLATLAACTSGPAPTAGDGTPPLSAAKAAPLQRCETLAQGFAHAGTRLESAAPVAAGTLKQGDRPLPAHCLVKGKLNERQGRDGRPYAIGFEMRLPVDWNGRFYYQGNGGLDGAVQPALGALGGGPLTGALMQGFAVLSSDAGHSGPQTPFSQAVSTGIPASLSAATMVFQWFMLEPAAANESGPRDGIAFAAVVRTFTPALRELLVSDILIRFCERIPYAFVVLWAIDHGGLTAQQFGWLVTIEMGTAMVCYIPVAHLAEKHGRGPFVLATFVFFTLFPLSLIWATDFKWLALAFVLRGLKEFGEPARKAMIIGEARPELRARTYGAYYLIRDCAVTGGSFLGAWLWSLGPRWNFTGAAVCGLSGTIWFGWFVCRRRSGD